MGMVFRLNLKWGFPIHSHFKNSSPSKLFSVSSSVSSESFCKSGLSQTDEIIQVPSEAKRYVSNLSLAAPNATHFGLLMQNLGVLEDIFADSDVSSLEREILLQLGKFGALNLFNTCLSRTLEALDFWDLCRITKDYYVEENVTPRETGESPNKRIVRSVKIEERRSRRRKRLECHSNGSETILELPDVSSARRAVKSRSRRRVSIAKNEEEMATGVKMVVKLERIRSALESESGEAASLSRWAEAAGLDESVLKKQLHFGWHCQDELMRSTKSLVLYISRSYRGLGIALDDLLQAGKLGVLQGAERFDQTRGYRFSTYAHYWIRKSMSSLVARHSRGILIPVRLSKAIKQIQKTRKEVNNKHRRYPDDDEIANLTGLSLEKIKSASNCLRVVGSVDHKVSDSFSGKHMEFMADETIKNPEESVMRQHLKTDIHDLLSVLDSRERRVLILRYGLTNSAPKSLEEIGKLFHVSREWIRKIENKAMRKLRDEETERDLSHYLNI